MRLEQPTPLALRRRGAPLCPVCSHRSRTVELFDLYARMCRWGHVVAEEEMIRGGRETLNVRAGGW